ncbi:MAG: hypothetical protein EHM59_08275 [Betaproteobacteria bacterium]|nr:MAG: hypothetical protein EHM59_08275 [Betaproteobacteria bacterium]
MTVPRSRHLRVFVSSPGDVADERAMARQIVEDLPYDPFLRGRLTSEVVAWDKPGFNAPMFAGMAPQEAINLGLPRPGECDLVVVILWSRMGTPLPDTCLKPSGERYLSGTEWEFEDALASARKPDLLVYRRSEPLALSLSDPDIDSKREQHERVEGFFARFENADGSLASGYNVYRTPSEFQKSFEHHLRSLLSRWFPLREPLDAGVPIEPAWQGSPYPGLRPLGIDDARIFFGRARETDALLKMLRQPERRFLAVWGPSGSGKSSLVGAGLLPRLAQNAIAGSKDWLVVRFTPAEVSDDPFAALAVSLHASTRQGASARALSERLSDREADPVALVTALLAARPDWAELVLFADQLEELFTLVAQDRIGPFVALLDRLAGVGRLRIVATLREDFLSRCAQWPSLMELVQQGSFPLAPPGPAQLHEMITRPATRAGLELEGGLPEKILEDAGNAPGALPLMAYALEQLYRSAGSDSKLTLAAYAETGGIRGAIGRQADATFERLDPEAQAALPRLFRDLVEIRADGVATRRRVGLERLAGRDAASRLVDALVAARLLVKGKGEIPGSASVEVAHEAIFQGWSRLRAWLESNAEFLQWRHRFQEALAEWERVDRNPGALLGGLPLAEAERWIVSDLAEPTPREIDFVRASREEEQRLETLAKEAQRRREQEALRLVADAYRTLYSAPENALLLAAEALQIDPTPQAEAAQAAAFEVISRRREVQEQDAREWGSGAAYIAPTFFEGRISAQLSRDGRYAVLATDREGNDAYVLDYRSLKLTKLEPPQRRDPIKRRLEYLGIGTSGRKIYLARQFNIEIYSIAGEFEREFYLTSTKYPINLVDAVDDDRVVVAADTTGSVFTVDPATEKPLGTITWWKGSPVMQLEVSPSGRWAVMLHKDGVTVVWPIGEDADPKRWSSSSEKNIRLPGPGVISVAFSPSAAADVLLAASRDGFVSTWRLDGNRLALLHELAHGMPVEHASFSADGSRILTIADDRVGRIWDAASGTLIGTIGDPVKVDWLALRRVLPSPIAWPAASPLPLDAAIPIADLPAGDRLELAGQTWAWPPVPLFQSRPAYRILGERAISFPNSPGVSRLLEFEGHVWLLHGAPFSEGPVFRVDEASYVSLAPLAERVTSIEIIDGALWLLTGNGAYRIRGDTLERVTPEGVKVRSRVDVDGQTWLLSSAGAYRLESGVAVRISDRIPVLEVKKAGTRTWILAGSTELFTTTRGPAYWVDGYRAVAVASDYNTANFVTFENGIHWLGTDRGLYGITDGETFRVQALDEGVDALHVLGARLWAQSRKAVFRIDGRIAHAFRPHDPELNVDRLEQIGGRLWLFTTRLVFSENIGTNRPGPVYVLDADAAVAAPTQATPIRAVHAVDADLWFIADRGPAYRLRAGALKAFPRKDAIVHGVSVAGGAVWLRAEDGAYRMRGERARRLPNKTLSVWSIEERDGHVLVTTQDEAYQVDGDTVVQVAHPGTGTLPAA